MASWCGSTRSFCREQKPQGKRKCGEKMPTELRSLEGNRRMLGHFQGQEGERTQSKVAFALHFGQTGEEVSVTCNIYWKSSCPWP